jgi:hypothetical protein
MPGTYTRLSRQPNNWLGALPIKAVKEFEATFGTPLKGAQLTPERRDWINARAQTGWPHNHRYI